MHGSLALLVSVEVKNLSVQLKREVRACIFVEQISSSASERLCFSLRCTTVIFASLFSFFFSKWYNFFVLNLQVGSQNNEVVMYSLVFLIVKFYSKG